MIAAHAQDILSSSKVPYLQDKTVTVDEHLCIIDIGFAVDHEEPEAALAALTCEWRLGELPAGCEFLAIVFRPT